MVEEIDPVGLSELLREGKVVLIDVREPDEFRDGHIAEAISIPLSVFAQRFDRTQFAADKTIVLQCQRGVRSMKACDIAQALFGQECVTNLTGGLNAWKEAGLPVSQ